MRIFIFSFKQRPLQTRPQLLAVPLMTTRLTQILFIWPLLLSFSFSLYLLLFTFSWLVLEKVCMQFEMFTLDKCECVILRVFQGFLYFKIHESPMHFILCDLARGYLHVAWVAFCCQVLQENMGREGGGHCVVTVMLILHCRNHSILPSQIQLSHWGMALM